MTGAPPSSLASWFLRLPDGVGFRVDHLGFERPIPGWGWLLIAAAAAAFSLWSVRGMAASPRRRAAIAALRALLLLLIVLLLSGPQLSLPRDRVEPDWVIVLADRSGSLHIEDVVVDEGFSSREHQLRQAIIGQAPVWRELATTRRVVFFGFDAGLRELSTDEEGVPILGEPDGVATEIGPALAGALDRAAARPVSGVVLVSDGRTTAPPDRSLLRRIASEGVRVHVVPLGSAESSGDHAVRSVDAPQRAFIKDEIPIEVDLERSPGVGGALRVKLVDEETGRVLDAREFNDDLTGPRTITLVGRADEPGERSWRVEIEPDGRDLVPENNARSFRVEVLDRPIRVLYIEGSPRWEYRYLKNLLVRERGIESSVMLLSADRDFAQEGNAPLTRLPRNLEEFSAYDLVIIGDIPAGALSPAQSEAIKELVSKRGTGLMWIGGPRATPRSWKGAPLEELLPLRGSLELERFDEAVTMRPSARAARLGLMRVSGRDDEPWPDELASPAAGWSRLEWAQRIDAGSLKPTAEVIAETASGDGGRPQPLLVSMRYGAGQSIYLASDETWRWRYARGETVPERFWLQILRHLARTGVSSEDRRAQLAVEPRRVQPGDPVRIEFSILDPEAARSAASRLEAHMVPAEGSESDSVAIELAPVEDVPGRFSATLFPDRPGVYQITVTQWPGESATLEVARVDWELADPQADHALLTLIAAETQGEVLRPEDLHRLLRNDLLPNRAVTIENPQIHALWDTPLALILLVLIPAVEWSVRRWSRLA